MPFTPDNRSELLIARRDSGWYVERGLAGPGEIPAGDFSTTGDSADAFAAYETARNAAIAAEEFTPEAPADVIAAAARDYRRRVTRA